MSVSFNCTTERSLRGWNVRRRAARGGTVGDELRWRGARVSLLTGDCEGLPSWSLPDPGGCADYEPCDIAEVAERARVVRLLWTREQLETLPGQRHWVAIMSGAIGGRERFLIHERGYFFNCVYAEMWARVCEGLGATGFQVALPSAQLERASTGRERAVESELVGLLALPNVRRSDHALLALGGL